MLIVRTGFWILAKAGNGAAASEPGTAGRRIALVSGKGGQAGRPAVDGRPVSQSPMPVAPRLPARWLYRLHSAVEPNRAYRALAGWLQRGPALGRLFTTAEHAVKKEIFGCEMCGQCALPVTGYACPMTCPKQLRNGPCGGVGADGSCEVFPQLRCVWLDAVDRATATGHALDLEVLQRPIDHRVWGQSSWVNYWQGRDDELWTADPAASPLPAAAQAGPER